MFHIFLALIFLTKLLTSSRTSASNPNYSYTSFIWFSKILLFVTRSHPLQKIGEFLQIGQLKTINNKHNYNNIQ